jgi:hypothetical protein
VHPKEKSCSPVLFLLRTSEFNAIFQHLKTFMYFPEVERNSCNNLFNLYLEKDLEQPVFALFLF